MSELLVILVIVLLLFGTKKLRTIGSDLGGAIKGFRKAMAGEDEPRLSADDSKEEHPSVTNQRKDQSDNGST